MTEFGQLAPLRRTWKHAFRKGWAWGEDTTNWFVQETSRLVPTIVVDPPYELNLQARIRMHRELARVHRPGGRLLWKAPWLPPEGLYEVHDVHVQSIRAGLPRDAHLLVRATRRFPSKNPKKRQLRAADKKPHLEAGQCALGATA